MESTRIHNSQSTTNATIIILPQSVGQDNPNSPKSLPNGVLNPNLSARKDTKIKYHCFHCKKVFSSRTGWKEHASAAGKDHENLPPCRESHETHRLVNGTFNSFEEARAWASAQEFDKTMSIVTSQTNYLIYKCRHNSRHTSNRAKPCPQRRRVSLTKFDCKARVVVNKTCLCRCETENAKHICFENEETIRMSGCVTHCHDLSQRFDRIPKATKNNIEVLLKAGVSKSTILKDYCSSIVGQDNAHKIITMQDIRNIENHLRKKHLDPVVTDPVQIFESRKQRSIRMLTEWRVALFAEGPQSTQEDIIQQVEEIEAKLKVQQVLTATMTNGTGATTKEKTKEQSTEHCVILPTEGIQANQWTQHDIVVQEVVVQNCVESPVDDPNWMP